MRRLRGTVRWAVGCWMALALVTGCDDASSAAPGSDAAADTANGDGSTGDSEGSDAAAGSDGISTAPTLYVNEIAAAGDPDDWIELYNPGDSAVDLAGWKFADSLSDPAKQVGFASGASVPAKGFLQIPVTSEVQGFKLGSDEEVGLWDPQGNLVDSVDWNEGDSPAGGSYGRSPDGGATWQTFATATPGGSNAP